MRNRPKNRDLAKRINGLTALMTAAATLLTALTGFLGTVVKSQSDKIDRQSQQFDQLLHRESEKHGPPPPPPGWSPPPPPR
jgi:hypothetical protein